MTDNPTVDLEPDFTATKTTSPVIEETDIKPKKHLSKTTIITGIVGLFVIMWYLLLNPRKVSGDPFAPFQSDGYLLSERVSYFIRDPKIGDMVEFQPNEGYGMSYFGLIANKSDESYQIITGSSKKSWDVNAKQIVSRIYYPVMNDDQKSAVRPTPSPNLSPTPSPSPSPSPSVKPPATKKPVLSPLTSSSPSHSATPTPVASNQSAPSPTPTPAPTQRASNPPQVSIGYPTEGDYIEMNSSQTLCVVDIPSGGDLTGVQRAYSLNGSGVSVYTSSTVCIDPAEGSNTLTMSWKNSYGEVSNTQVRQFTFHRTP